MPALADMKLSTLLTATGVTTDANIGVDTTMSVEGWKPGSIASWVDRSGGVPLGYKRTTFAIRPPTKDSPVFKISNKFYFPVLETIDPATGIFGPRLAYELQAHIDVLIPARATAAERTAFWSLLRSHFMNLITASDGTPSDSSGTPLRLAITNLEDVY